MNDRHSDWAQLVGQVILILAAIVAVAAPIADLAGLLENVQWLRERIPTITLLAVGLLIAASIFDRRTVLARIETLLRRAVKSQALGVQYLPDRYSVLRRLEDTVSKANETLMAVGAKSTATIYLQQVSRKVASGDITYYRLLTGNHITHELHEHLGSLLGSPDVHVAWNYSEKFGTFTVSEDHVVLAIPSPHPSRFTGIMLPGSANSRLFTYLFLEAFRSSTPITGQQQLALLCQRCSPNAARTEKSLSELLEPQPAAIEPQQPKAGESDAH